VHPTKVVTEEQNLHMMNIVGKATENINGKTKELSPVTSLA
jgi:hypothetical protein